MTVDRGSNLRAEVKKRDNFECQECKRNGRVRIDTNEYSESAKRKNIQLVVHYIKGIEHHPEYALNSDILKTVCVNCHNKKTGQNF